MKVKICPLCDSETKKAHYCDTCHSFIWRPESWMFITMRSREEWERKIVLMV
ncbi:MAG: hypothetical protein ACLUI7_02215 [Coprococcus sp.]